jgi:hypothetical protein
VGLHQVAHFSTQQPIQIEVLFNSSGSNMPETQWLHYAENELAPMCRKVTLSEQERYDAAVQGCNAGDKAACDTRDRLIQISSARDGALRDACAVGGASPGCLTEVQRAQAAGNTVFVDGRGNITVNGLAFATAGPIVSPFTTSTAGQMAQSTAEGLILEVGNQASGAAISALASRILGRAVAPAGGAGGTGTS